MCAPKPWREVGVGFGWYGCTTVERWFAVPNYFDGIVNNVEEILEMHKIATQSCFGTEIFCEERRSKKQPSGKVHIKACIAELYSSVIVRTVTRNDLLISSFYLFIY